ncbi:MAG: hypothetical protein IPJ87_01830 [Flavobacteriales bacterium]|nr:hypothetical protein [Flavobacteriales bacterium]MBK9700966.1 hypothetical protein [Flavobacteriales bacterium]
MRRLLLLSLSALAMGPALRAQAPCTDWRMIVDADLAGHEITWEVLDAASGLPVATGGPYMNNSHNAELLCLPLNAAYRLVVHDSGGDGICPGGYALEDPNGERVIDNLNNGCTYGAMSALCNNLGFTNPIGLDRVLNSEPQSASCSRLNYLTNDFFIATPNPAVDPANGDGYQFWIFDPNGSYSRRVFQSGVVYNGWPDADPNDACYLRFAWMQTNPVPFNVLLNIAVRTRLNGVFGEFGPVCQAMVLPAAPACQTTRLVDHPLHPDLSCGVTRSFGGTDQLHAISLAGATDYRFRFVTDGGGFVRQIASSGATLTLNWTTLPLSDGAYYDVTVQPSFDGGATWCPFGPVCTVLIDNTPAAAPRGMPAAAPDDLRIRTRDDGGVEVRFTEACGWRVLDVQGRLVAVGRSDGPGWQGIALGDAAPGVHVLQVVGAHSPLSLRFVHH